MSGSRRKKGVLRVGHTQKKQDVPEKVGKPRWTQDFGLSRVLPALSSVSLHSWA